MTANESVVAARKARSTKCRGCEPVAGQHRRRRQRQLLLADVVARPGPDASRPGPAAARASARRRRSARRPGRRSVGLMTMPPQVGQHVVAGRRIAAPPGRHRRQPQLLAEQVPAQRRQKGEQRRRLDQAAAQRVGHRDVARPHRLHQARHAQERVAAQLQRIAVVVVQPAEDDVDRLQAAEQLEVDAVVAARSGRRPRPGCSRGSGRGRRARNRSRCTARASAGRCAGCRGRAGRCRAGCRGRCGRTGPAAAPGSRGTRPGSMRDSTMRFSRA